MKVESIDEYECEHNGLATARMKRQLDKLERRNKELEAAAATGATAKPSHTSPSLDKETQAELNRLREIAEEHTIAKDRIATLEEQLVENAKMFAAELAEAEAEATVLLAEANSAGIQLQAEATAQGLAAKQGAKLSGMTLLMDELSFSGKEMLNFLWTRALRYQEGSTNVVVDVAPRTTMVAEPKI